MKTYENFLLNTLKKRKKLPKEVVDLGDALYKFFKRNLRPDWDVSVHETESKNKDNNNIISVFVDPFDLEGASRVLSLYYNDVVKRVMLSSIINLITLDDMLDFIETVAEKYSAERKYKELKEYRIFISIDNIYKVIDEISDDDNYEKFLDQKKYNL